MKRDLTENDVREDPEGAVLAIRRARREVEAAEQRVEQFELVFSAFDQLRRSNFAAPEYSPQWKARALAAEDALRAASGEPVHVVEWEGLMDAERARQVDHGYDDDHDAQQGVAHLLSWAIDYGRRGKPIAAATMTRCAFRMTNVMLHDLIDSLSHVDESTDPVLLAARVIARLQGNPNWESVEVAR